MRNIYLAVAAVLASSSLIGCVGNISTDAPVAQDGVGGGTTGSAADTARAAFDSAVYPIISTKCIGCHLNGAPAGNLTGFVAKDAADGYETATGYQALVGDWSPADAPILTKIAAGHNGQTYAPADITAITTWLNDELAARAGQTTGTGTLSAGDETTKLFNQWSGCMTLTNFQTANMKAWGNMQANNSACKTCHINGEYGELAMDVDQPFFMTLSTNKYYLAEYFSVDLSMGVDKAQVIVNERSFTGVGQGLPPHTEHPLFKLAGSTGLTALQMFYTLTMANLTAGTCGPSTLTQ